MSRVVSWARTWWLELRACVGRGGEEGGGGGVGWGGGVGGEGSGGWGFGAGGGRGGEEGEGWGRAEWQVLEGTVCRAVEYKLLH